METFNCSPGVLITMWVDYLYPISYSRFECDVVQLFTLLSYDGCRSFIIVTATTNYSLVHAIMPSFDLIILRFDRLDVALDSY